MNETILAVAPTPPAPPVTIGYPKDPVRLLQWVVEIAERQEVWQKGRMVTLTPGATLGLVRQALVHLQALEQARATERRAYLLNRWGTVLVGLDAAQPAEGDLIVCERKDGQREQCVVEGGVAWTWKGSAKGLKFANVSTITKWRMCELPPAPAETHTVKSDVKAALERGRTMAGNGAGLLHQVTGTTSRVLDKPPAT